MIKKVAEYKDGVRYRDPLEAFAYVERRSEDGGGYRDHTINEENKYRIQIKNYKSSKQTTSNRSTLLMAHRAEFET